MLRPKPATAAALVVGFAVALPPQTALANPVNYDCRINENPPPLCKFLSARSGTGETARDPFLCRFGADEAGVPVLVAATRDDCTRAGGVVMTLPAPDEAASE